MQINYSKKKCGKVVYKSKEDARKALKELRARGARRFYRCPYRKNNAYHLTSETN